tara:strand:- start:814 stop:1071 length:258 start_codon:yes stop_codon:yes gene_type:complete
MAKESLDTAVNLLYVNSIGTLENIMAKLNWQKLYTQSKEQSKRERSYDPTHSMTRRCDIKLADKQAKQDRLIRNKAMAMIKANKS